MVEPSLVEVLLLLIVPNCPVKKCFGTKESNVSNSFEYAGIIFEQVPHNFRWNCSYVSNPISHNAKFVINVVSNHSLNTSLFILLGVS